jgi:CHAD domain-containing protein
VSKQRKRLKKVVRALDPDADSPDAETALHEVRKSAKRLRYDAESAAPIFGKRATKLARAAEEIQEILGDHQDSVVTRALLRELAAGHRGKSAFTFGRLHALEQAAGDDARERFFSTWNSSPPKPLRWK